MLNLIKMCDCCGMTQHATSDLKDILGLKVCSGCISSVEEIKSEMEVVTA